MKTGVPELLKGMLMSFLPDKVKLGRTFPPLCPSLGQFVQRSGGLGKTFDEPAVKPDKTQEALNLLDSLGDRPLLHRLDLLGISGHSIFGDNMPEVGDRTLEQMTL